MNPRGWALGVLLVASTCLVVGCGDDAVEKAPERITSRTLHTECGASVSALQGAIEVSYASTGRYPETIGDLVRDGFVAPGDTVTAATGTTFSRTSAAGTYVVTMTFDADGVPVLKGTIDGSPC